MRMRPEDLLRLQSPSDPQPKGGIVAHVVSWLDPEADERRSRICLDGRPLTAGPHDMAPRWSPDGGSLAFLRTPDGRDPQVFVLPAAGGEAAQLSHDLKGAIDLRWSPDGRRIAVLAHRHEPSPATAALRAALDWPPTDTGQVGDERRVSERQPETGLRVTDRLTYRDDGLGYSDERRRHLFVLDAATGASEPLTGGAFDVDGFDWHPDGRRLAYIAHDTDGSARREIRQITVQTGESRRLCACEGGITALAWSPGGQMLAFFAHDGRHGWATQHGLWLYDDATGQAANVTAGLDRAAGSALSGDVRTMGLPVRPQWAADGRRIFFTAISEGNTVLLAARPEGLAAAAITHLPLPEAAGAASEPAADGQGGVCFLWEDPTHPPDLWRLGYGADRPARVTALHEDVLRELELGPRERLAFTGPGGLPIEGWLQLPPGFDPARRYPLVLHIHGGPHGSYGNTFSHEWQTRAAADRVVLTINPRGSGGYGQDFVRACVGDWGGKDFADLMAGVDAALARGFTDPARMAVTGISYGGFMTCWTVTHTDRFAAAITEMCVSNLVSFYGTSDIGPDFAEFEIPGSPWDGADALWAHSPMKYVAACGTPTLVIHGESDYRCPIEQGEQFYTALRRRGVETALIRVPGASHVFSIIGKPSQRVGRLRAMEAWLRGHGI